VKVKVEVIFIGQLAEETGYRNLTVEASDNLKSLLLAIEQVTGLSTKKILKKSHSILVNGRSYYLLGKESTELKENDTVIITPKLGGG